VPASWSSKAPRLAPLETTTFRVSVLLMSMIREDDADIHLVVADPKGVVLLELFPRKSS
jgi:hypothetical protein